MKRTNKKKIIIVGAGGHGSELASYIEEIHQSSERVELCGYADEHSAGHEFNGYKVLGNFERFGAFLKRYPKTHFYYITAVGNNAVRLDLVKKTEGLKAVNLHPWILRHPLASCGRLVEIGQGSCLAPGSVVTTKTNI